MSQRKAEGLDRVQDADVLGPWLTDFADATVALAFYAALVDEIAAAEAARPSALPE